MCGKPSLRRLDGHGLQLFVLGKEAGMRLDSYISGGISGAISDPYSKEAVLHAEMYYEEIRNNHADVKKISQNTTISYDQALLIKQYLFLNVHDLDGELRRFDPNFEIAQSWQRLAFEPSNIKPHDLTLLNHELYEISLVNRGVPQNEAHVQASERYPYGKESKEYYKKLGIKSLSRETDKKRNSGAISWNDYDER